MDLCSPIISLIILANTMSVALCLFQLTGLGETTSVSNLRLGKFLGEMTVCLFHHFYMCNCSEQLDQSSRQVNSALYNLNWFYAPLNLRKHILIMLHRTQLANYMKFSQGANYVFRRESFIKMVKSAYKFVNFMKMKK